MKSLQQMDIPELLREHVEAVEAVAATQEKYKKANDVAADTQAAAGRELMNLSHAQQRVAAVQWEFMMQPPCIGQSSRA